MTDILIADYSSIAVEYSLLNRPIILYAFDKEWYLSKDRGFYFDYEKTAPGPIVENMQDLIDCMKNEQWDLKKVESSKTNILKILMEKSFILQIVQAKTQGILLLI